MARMARPHVIHSGGTIDNQGTTGADPFILGGSTTVNDLYIPSNPLEFGTSDEVTFQIDVQSVQGAPTAWSLSAKFQLCIAHTTGYQYTAPRWFDLQDEQVRACVVEGVGWYGGSHTAPQGAGLGIIADQSDTLPLTVQRTVRHFGTYVRVVLVPSFTGGTTPTITLSSLIVPKG